MVDTWFDPRPNRICELLGIDEPIIQGGMAWTATAELAAAVSNAGGLGVIGGGQMPTALLRAEIHKARSLTEKPFGVNIMAIPPSGEDDSFVEEQVDMLIQEQAPVVIFGAGNPAKYMSKFKAAGTIVIGIAPTGTIGQRMEETGIDAVIGEGMEAGGHIGELTTLVLVPQLVDAVSIPVIAAGGIGDNRGVTAAFALGAEGVQVGTRFMCAEECTVHPDVKARIKKAKDRETVISLTPEGHPVRAIKNKLTKRFGELDALGDEGIGEKEALGKGALSRCMREGDVQMGSLMSGQIAWMVKGDETAAHIVRDLSAGLPGNSRRRRR